MSKSEPESVRFVPVPEAEAETGVPSRTIYRWARAKKVPSRREGDLLLVDLEAVRAHAAGRSATPVPASAGVSVVNGAVAGGVAKLGGDVSGEVFSLLKRGVQPIEIVERLQLPPDVVEAQTRKFVALTELATGGKASISDRLTKLEEAVAAQGKRLATALHEAAGVEIHLGIQIESASSQLEDHRGRLAEIEARLANLPLPDRKTDFSCVCGCRGYYDVVLRCGCGREHLWGFKPPRQ
jgi:hypothetical protein